MNTLKIKRLSDEATLPTRAHKTDAGLDIYAAEEALITRENTRLIETGIAIDIPEGHEGQIRPRSGKTSKTALRVQLGTVDAGYNGELKVICDCHPKEPFYRIDKGEKIAQLVINPVCTPSIEPVNEFSSTSKRGEKGFGSTD